MDEGKGSVALWLAYQRDYAAYVRTGGENAEHRVVTPDGQEHCFHILPSALAAKQRRGNRGKVTTPMLILAAGMTFSLKGLGREIREHGVDCKRLLIDRNAAIITDGLRESGQAAAKMRGSTFLGVGATMAAKVARAGKCVIAKNAGVISGDAAQFMHEMLQNGQDILLEGSQGTMLSLDHGYYPYCTSRNVTAMGALSDAGLNWQNVRDVYMVVKTVPTRVPGNSGPSRGFELTWEAVCRSAGRPYEHMLQSSDEGAGKGAGGLERPFSLSMPELSYAAKLNGATKIVLTFADWWAYEDLGATERWDLSAKTRKLVALIEHKVGVPVVMVRTGPLYHNFVICEQWKGEIL